MTQFDFFPAIPATNNSPSVDQPNMQTNNQSTNDILAIDHITFNAANGGTHKQVTIVATQSAPSVVSPQGIITTQTVTNSELFYSNNQKNVALTNTLLTASSGQGMMPGGLQIRAASATGTASSSQSISFSTAFPTGCLAVVVSYSGGGSLGGQTCSAGTLTSSGFTLFLTGSATGVYYIAIGY